MARQSPLLPDLAEVTRNYMRLLGPVMTNGRPPEFYEQMRSLAATLGPDDQSLDAIYVAQRQCRLARVGSGEHRPHQAATPVGELFKRMGRRALPADADAGLQARSCRAERPPPRRRRPGLALHQQLRLGGAATAAGLPATVAPIGRTDSGLPIGVQIIGPYLEDLTPIQFAQLLEQAFGGFVPPVL